MKGETKRLFTSERRILEKKGVYSAEQAKPAACPLSNNDIVRLAASIDELKEMIVNPSGKEKPKPKTPEMAELNTQLNDLGDHIYEMKREIASMRQVSDEEDRLTAAALELDAIVESTEHATHSILNAAEEIGELLDILKDRIDDVGAQALVDESIGKIVQILEACNFQDICGQRTNKVINTIKYLEDRIVFLEERIISMISVWGKDGFKDIEAGHVALEGDDALLNGPQHEEKAVNQSDIDAMFE